MATVSIIKKCELLGLDVTRMQQCMLVGYSVEWD